jgi:hypothetical protein
MHINTPKVAVSVMVATAMLAGSAQAHAEEPTPLSLELEAPDNTLGKVLTLGGVGATHAALYTFAYFAWYKGRNLSPQLEFRDEGFFEVDTYAGGSDKLGHMYSNYVLTRGTAQLLQLGGWDKLQSSLMSAGLTAAFFTTIEIKDGYHANFGFSWGDMAANATGIALALTLENFPSIDAMFDVKIEYVPTDLFVEQLINEGLLDAAEDYSGQTFMLSYHLASIKAMSESRALGWTRYTDVVVGFKSLNYLPTPVEPGAVPQQDLFIGVSLNLQQVFDDLFYDNPKERGGTGYGALAFANEVVAVPFTTLPLVTTSRTALDDAGDALTLP